MSIIATAGLYKHLFGDFWRKGGSGVCSLNGWSDLMSQLSHPAGWFALFAMGLTFAGAYKCTKDVFSNYPLIAQSAWLTTAILTGLALLVLRTGCGA
jgi:hypothetical protein